MHHVKKFYITMLKCDLYIVLSDNVKKFNKLAGTDRDSLYCEIFAKDHTYIILFNTNDDEFGLDDVHHEVNHMANYIMDAIGQEPNYKNDELESYARAYLFKIVLDHLVKMKVLEIKINRKM